jgi:F-type H+-transporting ATPase subunit epsilon
MALTVKIIAPDKVVWDGTADEVILPSATGELGILSNHAPLVSALGIGVLQVKSKGQITKLAVMGGFVEVENNEITILANGAASAEHINEQETREQLARAQKILESTQDPSDQLSAKTEIQRASAKLKAIGKS